MHSGRIAGLSYIHQDLTEMAIGVRGEDGARLVGGAVSRKYDVNRFPRDLQADRPAVARCVAN
jgi:hypothetical protein